MILVTMGVICLICFLVSTFGLFPLHILFKLQDMKKQEKLIRRAFLSPKYKYFNFCINLGILFEFILGLGMIWNLWAIQSNNMADDKQEYRQNRAMIIIFITWCIVDVSIHVILLYCYLKGLLRCSQYCYQKGVLEQVHETTIEITRYSVLFSIYVIIIIILNILIILTCIAWRYGWFEGGNKSDNPVVINTTVLLSFVVRDIGSVIILFFSFRFSYVWYKDRFCGICDDKMRNYCRKKVKDTDRRAVLIN